MDTITDTLKLLIICAIAIAVVGLTSCRSTRDGCPDTWGKVGYK